MLRPSTTLVHANTLTKIPFCKGPLTATSTIEYLTPEQYKAKFNCEYSESMHGDKDDIAEYLANPESAKPFLSKHDVPDIAVVKQRLKTPHDGVVICDLGAPFGNVLFNSRPLKAGEILFLYSGDLAEATPAEAGDDYQYGWNAASGYELPVLPKAVTSKNRGGLARFLMHLPVSPERHKAFLKRGMLKKFGENINDVLMARKGITLDDFIDETMSASDHNDELKNLVYTNPTISERLHTNNVTICRMMVDGVCAIVCIVLDDTSAYTALGFSYGDMYLESLHPRYCTSGGELIPESAYFKLPAEEKQPRSTVKFAPKKLNPNERYDEAIAKYKAGDYAGAIHDLRQCIPVIWKIAGKDSAALAKTYSALASAYREQGKHDEAVECCKQALAMFAVSDQSKLPAVKSKMQECLQHWMPSKEMLYAQAVAEVKCHRYVVAESMMLHLLANTAACQASELDASYYHSVLATCYREMKDYQSAVKHAELCRDIRSRKLGEAHTLTKAAKNKLDALKELTSNRKII